MIRLCFFLFITFLCVGCTQTNNEKENKARLYLQSDPLTLDPRIGGDRRSQIIIRELFEGLTRYGSDRKIELDIASSYTISSDGLVYTFSLAPVFWSNGVKIKADDFVYAWKSILDPSFPSQYPQAFFVIKNAKLARLGQVPLDDVGIRAIDDNTLEVTLEHPAPYFIELTSNPLYSPVYKPHAERDKNWASKVDTEFVCNGPYILKKRTPRGNILLEKNELYKDKESVCIQYLSFDIIEDPMTAYSLFSQGKLDWLGDPCGTISLDVLHDLDKRNVLIKKETDKLFLLAIGTHQAHLQSPTIRRAIATACNRQAICNQLLKGGEKPIFSIIPSNFSLLESPLFQDGNKQEALRLFDEGLKELGMSKNEYPVLVLSHWADPTDKAVAQALQEQIQNTLGITVHLESYDWPTYFKMVFLDKKIQVGGLGWWPWVFDPICTFDAIKFASNGMNGTQWEHPRFIKLLDTSDTTLDINDRKTYLREAENLVVTELPFIPLFSMPYKYTKSEGLEGEILSSNGMMEWKGLHKVHKKN